MLFGSRYVSRSVFRGSFQRWKSTQQARDPRPRSHDPLRILFCGSDEFSIRSLKALRSLIDNETLLSIDVACRPDKRVGRGLKKTQPVPIKTYVQSIREGPLLGLHEIDTFTGWSPPNPINLIIAVSFGLLVPARLLEAAKYGGLNIHPSLLPDLHGPAPIHHTLLKRRPFTGVTVQTMHPTRFDQGLILDQTPLPGLPVPPETTMDQLLSRLGDIGAEMLSRAVKTGLFIPPLNPLNPATSLEREKFPSFAADPEHAPKITPEDRRIDWDRRNADDVDLQSRVHGQLWDMTTFRRCNSSPDQGPSKRVTFSPPWTFTPVPQDKAIATPARAGWPVAVKVESQKPQHSSEAIEKIDIPANTHTIAIPIRVSEADDQIVLAHPEHITIEGGPKQKGHTKLYEAIMRRDGSSHPST